MVKLANRPKIETNSWIKRRKKVQWKAASKILFLGHLLSVVVVNMTVMSRKGVAKKMGKNDYHGNWHDDVK